MLTLFQAETLQVAADPLQFLMETIVPDTGKQLQGVVPLWLSQQRLITTAAVQGEMQILRQPL